MKEKKLIYTNDHIALQQLKSIIEISTLKQSSRVVIGI